VLTLWPTCTLQSGTAVGPPAGLLNAILVSKCVQLLIFSVFFRVSSLLAFVQHCQKHAKERNVVPLTCASVYPLHVWMAALTPLSAIAAKASQLRIPSWTLYCLHDT